MENAYIYTRVSTLIQVDGFSLEAQEAEIRAFAEARKINIVGKYTDEGKSGKNAEHRPAFTQMMEDIRSKKDNIRYVLVFKLSRFARNTSDTAKYLQELSSYGIGLLGIKDGIDTSTVTGKMIANIMGAVAEVELENIHEQTLAGRQQKARNGLWNGAQAPFGYSLKDKKLMIYPKEAETVKEIFRLYTEEGQSISYIAKKLNDENIQREQRGNVKISGFTDRTVRIILSNPVYAGMISYGRRHTVKVEGKNNETKVVKQDDESKIILVDGVHEPIVSKETLREILRNSTFPRHAAKCERAICKQSIASSAENRCNQEQPSITSNGVVLGFAHCFTDLLRELTKKTRISQRKRILAEKTA